MVGVGHIKKQNSEKEEKNKPCYITLGYFTVLFL